MDLHVKSAYHQTTSVLSILLLCLCLAIGNGSSISQDSTHHRKACKVPFDGRDGICINLESDVLNCPTLQANLLEKNFSNVYSAVCGELILEKLNETQVCCGIDEYIELYPEFKGSLHKHKNFKLIPTVESSACGQSFTSTDDRIIGGETVPPGAHPWMVRFGSVFPGDDNDQIRFHCAGAIINEQYILTAAHCLKEGKLRVIRLAETDEDTKVECILVGVNKTICQDVEDYEPEEIIIHDNYTGKVGSGGDIALIRLQGTIRNITSR